MKMSNNLFVVSQPMFHNQASFRENIAHLKSAFLLIVENALLIIICAAYMMYMTVSATGGTAESIFSKLKIIKNFLQSFMSQEGQNGLALLSIKNEHA